MAAHREVFVRLADGTTETGFFKERGQGEPASLEIGVPVTVGQRVSFVGGSTEWEVKTASWQRLAQWCHCELVPPTPRRLPPPAPGQGQVDAPAPVAPEPPPAPAIEADEAAKPDDEETSNDGE